MRKLSLLWVARFQTQSLWKMPHAASWRMVNLNDADLRPFSFTAKGVTYEVARTQTTAAPRWNHTFFAISVRLALFAVSDFFQ